MNASPARSDSRRAVLVVLTYGMNIRDVALNRALWSYLTSRYRVDVWTPVAFADPAALGIERVLDFPPPSKWSPAGVLARLRSRALAVVQEMRLTDFYMFTGLSHILNWAYSLGFNLPPHKKKWWYFSQFLYHTPWGESIRRFLIRAVQQHPLRRVARERDYRFVFLTHPRENNNQIAWMVASALGIPSVLAPLGLDNLCHGGTPIIEPDLALLWGEEQVEEHNRYLKTFNPALEKTVVVPVGSLVHDNYVAAPDLELDLRREHGCAPDQDIIVVAAHVEAYYPNQCEQVQWIVDYLRDRAMNTKIIVRVRPGFDEDMWRAFRDRNAGAVSLQMPSGVAYDKSGHRSVFQKGEEERNIAMFATTLRHARLLVAMALSTTYTDAQLLGTPAVALLCDGPSPETLFTRTRYHQHFFGDYPYYAQYHVAHDRAELVAFLDAFFAGARQDFVSDEIFRKQGMDRSGQGGARAAAALERMFPTAAAVEAVAQHHVA